MVEIEDKELRRAAGEGTEAFVDLVCKATLESVGGELTTETLPLLSADQMTLLAYWTLRREVMEGGFIQLIHNGYGPFIFLNPFGRALKEWGLKELRNMVYDGRRLYEKYGEVLERDMDDEAFMALYEQYEAFDDLDDEFVEREEEWTSQVAHYVDDHLSDFVAVHSFSLRSSINA